jgi:hypothetical protein
MVFIHKCFALLGFMLRGLLIAVEQTWIELAIATVVLKSTVHQMVCILLTIFLAAFN